MLLIIGILIIGAGIGYLLRKVRIKHLDRVIMLLVFVLLFLLGAELGTNQQVLERFASIGWKAITLSTVATLGSVVGAKILWIIIEKKNKQL